MKAEDTVIKSLCKKRVEVPSVLGGRLSPQVGHVNIDAELEQQAEFSFKAGIKEVDKFAQMHVYGSIVRSIHISLEEWQSKLKEWGIE